MKDFVIAINIRHLPKKNLNCSSYGDQNRLARKEENNLFFRENFMKKRGLHKKFEEKDNLIDVSDNLIFCDLKDFVIRQKDIFFDQDKKNHPSEPSIFY